MASLSAPSALRCERRTDPGPALGIGPDHSHLSWRIPYAPANYVRDRNCVGVTRPWRTMSSSVYSCGTGPWNESAVVEAIRA